MNEIIVCVMWKTEDGNYPDFPSLSSGDAWEDITGNYAPAPIYLLRARVGDATLSDIQGSSKAIILAKRMYEIVDNEEVESFNNYDETPTAQQLTVLYNLILDRFPGVDADTLRENAQEILQEGYSRQQVINKLAKRFRKL